MPFQGNPDSHNMEQHHNAILGAVASQSKMKQGFKAGTDLDYESNKIKGLMDTRTSLKA